MTFLDTPDFKLFDHFVHNEHSHQFDFDFQTIN